MKFSRKHSNLGEFSIRYTLHNLKFPSIHIRLLSSSKESGLWNVFEMFLSKKSEINKLLVSIFNKLLSKVKYSCLF